MSKHNAMPLPNFLIIGPPKCGTTALYATLARHPQVFMSPVKEPYFFAFDGCAAGHPWHTHSLPEQYAAFLAASWRSAPESLLWGTMRVHFTRPLVD